MIAASTAATFDRLAATLLRKAHALGAARAATAVLARRGDPRRWRDPGLVWPLFGKGEP